MKHSKRYTKAREALDTNKLYPLDEAIQLIKAQPPTKFDETIDIAISTGLDPKKADQALRGTISLPKGTGKTLRVIAFCSPDQVEPAKQAGAVEAGGEELVQKVADGWLDFDVAVAATPMMRLVGKLGRTLGPKGLMPSPKSGTVTDDVPKAVAEFAAGKIEYRLDAGGVVHAPVGKKSFAPTDLSANIQALIDQIQRSKPSSVKGKYIRNICLSSTMGPGVKLAV